jgi:hypothetical protein
VRAAVRYRSSSGSRELGILKMRVWLAVAVILVVMSSSGFAQQKNTFKVKTSPSEKAPKQAAPIGKTAGANTSSAANAKDLQSLERQTAKSSAPSPSAAKGTPPLKPAKDQANKPINFGGTGGGKKNAGMINQGSDPYKGRLREKYSH